MTEATLAAGPQCSTPLRFRIVENDIENDLTRQLSLAIDNFVEDSELGRGVDRNGYFDQTRDAMVNAIMGEGELWVGTLDEQLVIYILAGFTHEVDGLPTYWVSQAWVRKDQRGLPWVKQAWETIRSRAKEMKCAHIVTISGRENNQAYCRFLGPGWHIYGTLLKEDLYG